MDVVEKSLWKDYKIPVALTMKENRVGHSEKKNNKRDEGEVINKERYAIKRNKNVVNVEMTSFLSCLCLIHFA